jgi:hypothetical protein
MYASWTFLPLGFVTARRSPSEELRKYPLFKEFQETGKFWFPDAPERTWWGQVIFRPGDDVRIILDDPPWQRTPDEGIEVSLLQGRLSDGTPCTLLHGRALVETYYRDRPYQRATVFGQHFLGGVHLARPDDPQIASMYCQFTHLNEWFGSPYQVSHNDDSTRSVLAFKPSEFTLQLEAHGVPFELRSFCRRSIPWEMTSQRNHWPYDYCLHIHPTTPQSLAWFLTTAATLRRCFVFLIGYAIYTPRLDPMFVPGRKAGEGDTINGLLLQAVDIPSLIRTDALYFSTSYGAIAESLPQVIAAWFEQEEQLNIVMRAYAETLLNDGAYEESVFPGIVQVLEHFHAILFPGKALYCERPLWKAFFAKLREFIPLALVEAGAVESESTRKKTESFLARIHFLNQVTLQTKLTDLLPMIGFDFMPILNNPDDPEVAVKEFAGKVTTTRHFLTHPSKKQARRAFSGMELRRATSSCWAILTYWLARQLAIREDLAGEMALKAKYVMFLISQRGGL